MSKFRDILEMANLIANGVRLDETLTPEEFEEMQEQMATPTILPQPFDVTFAGWLARLEFLGQIKITHIDPEYGIKAVLTKAQFLKEMEDDSELVKQFGKWETKELSLGLPRLRMMLFREYVGISGKRWTEKYEVEVDPKPELKKALR